MTFGSGSRVGTRSALLPPLGVFLVALAARAAVLVMTVDVQGDAQWRTLFAYQWSRSPHWIDHGLWLPGSLYLGGMASLLVPSPGMALRFLNTLLGALTAWAVFALTRKLYGSRTAWVAGLATAVFPLHVLLSASSLSEPSFVFLVVLAELVLLSNSAPLSKLSLAGILGLALVVVAEMTRYEAWFLAPIFGAFLLCRSDRSWRAAIIVITALVAFPILWSVGNFIHVQDPFYGFTMARSSVVSSLGPGLFGISDSVNRVARMAGENLSVPFALVATGGLLLALRSLVRRECTAGQVLHFVLTVGFWVFAIGLAILRGPKLYHRYLVLGLVLSFPFAGVALEAISRGRTGRWLAATGLLVAACLIEAGGVPLARPLPVTRERPHAVIEVAGWLTRADHRNQPILLTEMPGATYFLQYAPALRWEIFGHQEPDSSLQRRLKALSGSFILVTRVGDEALLKRIQRSAPQLAHVRPTYERQGYMVLVGNSVAPR